MTRGLQFYPRPRIGSGNTCRGARLLQKVASAMLPVALFGCSAMPMAPGVAQAADDKVVAPQSDQSATSESRHFSRNDAQLMYELLVAELAGRRGQLDLALAGYLWAADHTDDVRVADRATRLAVYGRQWADAERMARRWLSLDSEAVGARDILAQVLLRQKKVDAAVAEIEQSLRESDDRSATLQNLYAELQRDADVEQSISVLRRLAVNFPDELDLQLGIARLSLANNDRQAALDAADAALSINAEHSSAVLLRAQILSSLGRPQEGFSAVQQALEATPDNNDLRLGYAQLLVEAGRYDDVGSELEKLFAAAGSNGDVLLTISLLALDSRRIEQAERYLAELLNTGEYHDQANFYLARISDQQQEYSDAISYYEAVQSGELQLTAQIRSAELLSVTGNLDAGRDRLHNLAAIQTNPAIQPRLLTAEARMLQEAGRAAEAVTVLTEGLSRFPENGELLYARALAADNAGDSDMLESDLIRLIAVEPDNAHALNALGYHLADTNIRLDEAEDYLVKANALKPNDAAIMDSLGWLRYRQGQYQQAAGLLREAYALYADSEIAAHLGEVLWIDGRESEARRVWEDALLESPDDDILLQVMQKFIE